MSIFQGNYLDKMVLVDAPSIQEAAYDRDFGTKIIALITMGEIFGTPSKGVFRVIAEVSGSVVNQYWYGTDATQVEDEIIKENPFIVIESIEYLGDFL